MVVSKAIVTFSYQNEKKKDWNTTFAVFECGLIFPSVSPNSGVSYGRENGGQTLPRWQRRGAGEECTARSCSQFVERYDGFHGISPDRLSHWISLVVVDCLKWLNVGPTVQYSTVFFSFFPLVTGHRTRVSSAALLWSRGNVCFKNSTTRQICAAQWVRTLTTTQ